MKILTNGHNYELESFEGTNPQRIQFIEKEPIAGNLETINDGTTNEEVLRVLIDRMNYLQDKFPCRENKYVIFALEEALVWLEQRTADRKSRGVEGKHLY